MTRSELALCESEERFRLIAENIDDVFWLSDGDLGRMYYVSPAYEKLWGRTCQSLYDDPPSFMEAIVPADRAAVRANIRTGQRFDLEYRIERPDGSMRWIQDRGFPVHDAYGNLVRYCGVAKDISSVKQATDEKERLSEQLRQAQKMEAIGSLAGGIAHDFNNLLTVINGYSTILLNAMAEDDECRADIAEIANAGQRAAALTSQLLAFSRKQLLQPRVLQLNEIIDGVARILRRLIGEDIRLVVDGQAGLGLIRADPTQIEQIVLNLAVNARDAMPTGGCLTLKTTTVKGGVGEVPPGHYALLTVSDTGTGISPEIQGRIFEPFFSTKGPSRGTGLGLSTVYGIVQQSRGFITVESVPSEGATFRIYLPQVRDEPQEVDKSVAFPVTAGSGETVLLVEDDTPIRILEARILRRGGYRVLEAGGGEEALRLLEQHGANIGLLVTDMVMPGLSGRGLAKLAQDKRPGLEVLFLTGYTDDIAVHYGALDASLTVLQKPFMPLALLSTVREVLGSAG
ncbi:MAG TPA: ATP-binding protein [Candidatus Xenobia bacterium]|jgi:PAS domain S-box-containing protein